MNYQKFEYVRYRLYKGDSSYDDDDDDDEVLAAINKYGSKGFEMSGYAETESNIVAVFKRPIFETSKNELEK